MCAEGIDFICLFWRACINNLHVLFIYLWFQVMEGRVKLAKVDCGQWPNICQSVGVHAYPTLRFYSGVRGGHMQTATGILIESQNADMVIRLVEKELNKADRLLKTEL